MEDDKLRPVARGWLVATLGGVALVALVCLVRAFPVNAAVDALARRLEDLGSGGPVAFVAAYVLFTVAFLPGAPLTLAAGALFGVVEGTILVSIGSTLGAACAFVIARYLARDRVASYLARHTTLTAVDEAIRHGGWKVVALLRLSPVMPFNVQNYLYGLTAIRFVTAILTSWAFMLPGTFLFVYLGYIGRAGVAAASGQSSVGVAVWSLRIVGLVATLAVTLYITRIAKRALAEHTDGAARANERGGEARSD